MSSKSHIYGATTTNASAFYPTSLNMSMVIALNSKYFLRKSRGKFCHLMATIVRKRLRRPLLIPAGSRFCHGDGADLGAIRQSRDEALNLLWRPIVRDVWHHDVTMYTETGSAAIAVRSVGTGRRRLVYCCYLNRNN